MALDASYIYGILDGLSAKKQESITIVQVGANDGVTNDPLHKWVKNNPALNKIILIEPQKDVFEKLQANYSFHQNVSFFNNAIGEPGALKLYRIRSEFDHLYQGIIASGITSYDRDYVLRKITKNLKKPEGINPEEFMECFEVETLPLSDLLNQRLEQPSNIDFLQVDTEGFDDQVIYQSSIAELSPSVINFEFIHLSKDKQKTLQAFLRKHGYRIIQWSSEDACAIKVSKNA